jgi:hypothetical protein
VCGGGATGIEAAAEFAAAYPGLQVRLVTQGLFASGFGTKIAAYMRQSLAHLGVTIQDHTTVTQVRAAEALTADGATLPFDVCLWTGGFSLARLAREAGLAVNERGQILIDPYSSGVGRALPSGWAKGVMRRSSARGTPTRRGRGSQAREQYFSTTSYSTFTPHPSPSTGARSSWAWNISMNAMPGGSWSGAKP